MLMNHKFLHHVKAKSLLVFGWVHRVILGNRKLNKQVAKRNRLINTPKHKLLGATNETTRFILINKM